MMGVIVPNEKRLILRQDAHLIVQSALAAVEPSRLIVRAFEDRGAGHDILGANENEANDIIVLGAGKAVLGMMRGTLEVVRHRICSGILIGNVEAPTQTTLGPAAYFRGGHPLPTVAGVSAAHKVRACIQENRGLKKFIILVSGGASSLLTLPASPVTLGDIRQLNELMLLSGADINQLNTVRKHCLVLAGGAIVGESFPSPLLALVLSDVVGNPLDVIASGPTVPDPSTFEDAHRVLRELALWDRVSPAIRHRVQSGLQGRLAETPKPGDPIFAHSRTLLIGSNDDALAAMTRKAQELGYLTVSGEDLKTGDISRLAHNHYLRICELLHHASGKPLALISGGEGTVTVTGSGVGGRNQHFVLEMVRAIAGLSVCVISAGTDGIDGNSHAAGARADGASLARGLDLGNTPEHFLGTNDATNFFAPLDDLIVTGPTGTNVTDVRCVLIAPGSEQPSWTSDESEESDHVTMLL